jgi:Zn ribbon nucleic-acid-binding protein
MNEENRCPRCDADRLRSWSELTDEEREVVKRLPAAAEWTNLERKATHRWCVRCWFESTEGVKHT